MFSKIIKNRKSKLKLEDLSVDEVIDILNRFKLNEFEEIVREKELNGKNISIVTEGIVKLWRIQANTKKFVAFVDDLKRNPDKYLINNEEKAIINVERNSDKNINDFTKASDGNTNINKIENFEKLNKNHNNDKDCNKITTTVELHKNETIVNVKHNEVITVENNGTRVSVTKTREDNFITTMKNAEDIIYKLAPPKSFLYKDQKTKKLKINTAYIPMNLGTPKKTKTKIFRFSSEFPMFDLSKFKYIGNRNDFNDRGYYSIKNQENNQEDLYRVPRIRHKSQCSEIAIENRENVFEDHLYEDLCYNEMEANRRNSDINPRSSYMLRLQGILHSFKMPSFFKNERDKKDLPEGEMYDSVHVATEIEDSEHRDGNKQVLESQVEEYLVPIQNSKDYCEVSYKEQDESFVTVIRKLFENIATRREQTSSKTDSTTPESFQKSNVLNASKMADRPLPVPIENEEYFMDVDRVEANRLLEGQEDGSFLLRPSTQPNHAYTLTVSCSGRVHNVGVRRRSDGRLALGYARKGQRTFPTVASLLRYHKKKKLVLVSGGTTLGSTVLRETPMYYQVPKNVPVLIGN